MHLHPLPADYKIEPKDELTETQKASFQDRNNIKKVLLQEGQLLCRFLSDKYAYIFSDFWITDETMKDIMSIFQRYDADEFKNDNFKKITKGHIKEHLAILNFWDSKTPAKYSSADPAEKLNYRVRIRLKKPVVAYVGLTGSQKNHLIDLKETLKRKATVERRVEQTMGGSEQIVIPRFWRIKDEEGFEYSDKDYLVSLFKERQKYI